MPEDSRYSSPHSRSHVCKMQCDLCFRDRATTDDIFCLLFMPGRCSLLLLKDKTPRLEDAVFSLPPFWHHVCKIPVLSLPQNRNHGQKI